MAHKPTPVSRDSSPRPRSVPRAQDGVKQHRNGSAKGVAEARRDLEERAARNREGGVPNRSDPIADARAARAVAAIAREHTAELTRRGLSASYSEAAVQLAAEIEDHLQALPAAALAARGRIPEHAELLADAAAAMVLFQPWSAGWWYYHLLMLVAVGLALNALIVERSRAKSFRSVIETALELEVSIDVEELDFEVIAALVAAVEVKDRETQGHNRRVAQLCVQIGRQLGMSATELRVLARTGLLHDVGKLGVPDVILEKQGPLNESEVAIMKTHPEIGVSILKRGGHFKRELLGVLYHHERMDGSGYPHGLVSDAIPIEARIVAVADTYDVLTTDRPYRRACGGRQARAVVQDEAGTHLDPHVVVALMRVLDRRESGSTGSRPGAAISPRASFPKAADKGGWTDHRTA